MPRPLLACVPFLLTCSMASADNCESISAQIDSKIRATGQTNYSLTIVDASSAGTGKVVGSCATGTRKIVYVAVAASAATVLSAGSSAARASKMRKPTRTSDIITECKDGSMSLGGECKD